MFAFHLYVYIFFSIIVERTAEKSPPIVHVSQITHSCVFIVYEFWFELCIKAKIDHYLNEFCWFDKHLRDVCVIHCVCARAPIAVFVCIINWLVENSFVISQFTTIY